MAQALLYGHKDICIIDLGVLEQNDIKKRIGNNLRRVRITIGLTQDEVGAKCDPPVDGSHIGAIEAGGGLRVDMLTRICNALKIDPSELYQPEGKAAPLRYPISEKEQQQLDLYREFNKLGEADRVLDMQAAYLSTVKKKDSTGSKGKAGGVPRRPHKRAG